jgi:signal peptidase I
VAVIGVYVAPNYVRNALLRSGIVNQELTISGTGSMYPTFPKGEGSTDIIRAKESVAWPKMRSYPGGFTVFGYTFLSYKLTHGDIVELENDKTKEITKNKYGEEAGFVKRLIALPFDTLELRDGFVYLNGSILNEPYTAKPRSTYGGDFLSDCKKVTVPPGKYVVMGDNRKASLDSRYDLGFISESDIHFVLPWKNQDSYKNVWRDTTEDATLAHTSTLNEEQFVELLNTKRAKLNLKKLKLNSQLSSSSKIRGDIMIKNDDFSLEASKSGLIMNRALKQAGYSNILSAELFTRGFYEAQELFDNFSEFPETKELLFSHDYQDIGLSSVTGEVSGCPTQVVVVHLGGYVPPNYAKSDIDSWRKAIENLNKASEMWGGLKTAEGIDKEKLNKLLNLLDVRKNNAEKIYKRMNANQWLTEDEKQLANEDKNLAVEIEKIVDELNKK